MTTSPQILEIKKPKKMGSLKGIETMYRNAYRAELDLIALATTKSNIMISINGFIVSALMISSSFVDTTHPILLGPAILFLSASAASIYFALLAASPNSTSEKPSVFSKFIRFFSKSSPLNATNTSSNILIYEDRVKLSKTEYLLQMRKLLDNQDKVYESMSDQLYWLGKIANHKFKMLKVSYFILRWGIIFSVISLLIINLVGDVTLQDLITKNGVIDQTSQLENNSSDKRLVGSFQRSPSDLESVAVDEESDMYI